MFTNREEAGRHLASHLEHLRTEDVVVLGLPRGGVPVAHEVARALDAPLDVIVVRKLGVPYQPELAMGAIGEDGVRILDQVIMSQAGVDEAALDEVEARERAELDRRAGLFRGGRPSVDLAGRVAVIVDDGIATGSTIRAATEVARALGAARVVVAAPVAPREMKERLRAHADEVVIAETPEPFYAIGQFYDDFAPTPDREVVDLLQRTGSSAGRATSGAGRSAHGPPVDDEVEVTVGAHRLGGRLTIPEASVGTVVFAHGSGSSRHSPRNRYVAEGLNRARLATLLFDLLTPTEEDDRSNVFDIELLASRLGGATDWLVGSPLWTTQPIGYFGASTGAAAALWAAAERDSDIAAVVSRGGRPDLAAPQLARVRAPTLLLVGGRDAEVLEMNRSAQRRLGCESRLDVIPDASHLFEEPGTLDAVADLARDWFTTHFGPPRTGHNRPRGA